ncbi:MAG: hypothetical protein ACM3OB_06195 [Acidobacteriota bacterium]
MREARERLSCAAIVVALGCVAGPAWAQDAGQAPEASEDGGLKPKLTFGIDAKLNFRHSDDDAVVIKFPPIVPPPVTLHTVDPGDHLEISSFALTADAVWSAGLVGHARVEAANLYDRNPTSTGKKVLVKELWLRFGRETAPATLPDRPRAYLKAGKFAHFERQNDRHLESWGLVSTAFNRFEDVGVEAGVDLGRFLYAKASYTAGNPLFMRDPNALAGDNGTPTLLQPPPDNVPKLGPGIPILYDTETQDVGLGTRAQSSVGLGGRWADATGDVGVDVLAFGRERKLADRVELEGTFYGADLDLLNGPFSTSRFGGPYSLRLANDRKREVGGNLWLYVRDLSVFAQYVDQDVAGLKRKGFEAEAAYGFELPLRWAVGGRQLFPRLQPAVRYSELKPEKSFDPANPGWRGGSPLFPAPSLRWDWRKIDYGLRLTIVSGIDLTLEYSDDRTTTLANVNVQHNEALVTLHWRM